MGNTAKFKELLEVAIQKDPENPELQYNLGVISHETDDFESSKKYYLRAIELKARLYQCLHKFSGFNFRTRRVNS